MMNDRTRISHSIFKLKINEFPAKTRGAPALATHTTVQLSQTRVPVCVCFDVRVMRTDASHSNLVRHAKFMLLDLSISIARPSLVRRFDVRCSLCQMAVCCYCASLSHLLSIQLECFFTLTLLTSRALRCVRVCVCQRVPRMFAPNKINAICMSYDIAVRT